MSYRNERAKILEERAKEIQQDYAEELKEGTVAVSDETVYYDAFFTNLLKLKHAIVTRDLNIADNFFNELGSMVKALCDEQESAYFFRVPLTIEGFKEYYDSYVGKVRPYFPKLESDLKEAIAENASRYAKFLKPEDAPAPAQTPTLDVPTPAPVTEGKIDIRKELRLPNPEEHFQRAKENQTNHSRALKYEQKLFRLYLDGLIDCMAQKYPEIAEDSRYKTFDSEEAQKAEGKGRKDYLNTRDGLFFMIDRVSQKTPSLRQYTANCSKDLYENWRFKKTYSETAFFTFLSTADCKNILYDMVIESVRDLTPYERGFSIDGTGFASTMKNDYNFNKHGEGARTTKDGRTVKELDWTSLQALTTQISNVVVIPRLYYKYTSSESEGFMGMVKEAIKEGFTIKRLCADMAYTRKEYRDELGNMGIDYYCEFPSNVKPPTFNDESPWAKQFRFQQEHPDEFAAIYHARSTVESVFGAIKKRVGERITSKTLEGYYKEVYCKVIVHNIFGMIHQLFINGVVPHFVDEKEIIRVVKSA